MILWWYSTCRGKLGCMSGLLTSLNVTSGSPSFSASMLPNISMNYTPGFQPNFFVMLGKMPNIPYLWSEIHNIDCVLQSHYKNSIAAIIFNLLSEKKVRDIQIVVNYGLCWECLCYCLCSTLPISISGMYAYSIEWP